MAIDDDQSYWSAIVEIEALLDSGDSLTIDPQVWTLVVAVEAYEKARPSPFSSAPSVHDTLPDTVSGPEFIAHLAKPVVLHAFIGWRSATVALRASRQLASPVAIAVWMNRSLIWTELTPLQLAEQDDNGLQMILDHLGRIEAGVFY